MFLLSAKDHVEEGKLGQIPGRAVSGMVSSIKICQIKYVDTSAVVTPVVAYGHTNLYSSNRTH